MRQGCPRPAIYILNPGIEIAFPYSREESHVREDWALRVDLPDHKRVTEAEGELGLVKNSKLKNEKTKTKKQDDQPRNHDICQ